MYASIVRRAYGDLQGGSHQIGPWETNRLIFQNITPCSLILTRGIFTIDL